MPGAKMIDIKRGCYAIASVNGDAAELTMYGQVVDKRPKNYWTGKEVEGKFIILDEFLEDLKILKNVRNITIRMNSVGGNVYAAIPIYNRMKELKANKTVIVDGVAMSAASFIMCAADTVKVNASSLVMIHRAALFIFGGYNADDLRKEAEFLDTVDRALATAYATKTGMSEDDVLAMMSAETYMTGKEAVEKSFADELTNEKPVTIAASADRRTLFVNGSAEPLLFPLSGLPESFIMPNPTEGEPHEETPSADEENTKTPEQSGSTKGGKTMSLEELKSQHPELYAQIVAEATAAATAEQTEAVEAAVQGERNRLKEIDGVSSSLDAKIVSEAKYGEKPCTAQELAFRALQAATKAGEKFVKDMDDDNKKSGAQKVPAAPGDDGEEDTPENIEAAAKAAASMYKNIIGGKKDE